MAAVPVYVDGFIKLLLNDILEPRRGFVVTADPTSKKIFVVNESTIPTFFYEIAFDTVIDAARSQSRFSTMAKWVLGDMQIAWQRAGLSGYVSRYVAPPVTAPPLTADQLERAAETLISGEPGTVITVAGRRGGKTTQMVKNLKFFMGRQWIRPGDLEAAEPVGMLAGESDGATGPYMGLSRDTEPWAITEEPAPIRPLERPKRAYFDD